MKKLLIAFIALTSILSARFEVVVSGVSVRFGKGASRAKRKLDDAGIFVFNPGVGVGYDFREEPKTSGFSPLVNTLCFLNCNNRYMFLMGAGARGRAMATDRFSFDINLLPSFSWIENRGAYFFPVIAAGMNYHLYDKMSFGMMFTFVPAFCGQRSNLGFLALSAAF